MIKYINLSNFEMLENFLLSHQDEKLFSTRYEYYFKQVGDCAGIFRKARYNDAGRGLKKGKEELIVYYHDGEF